MIASLPVMAVTLEPHLTTKQLAALLSVNEETVRRAAKSGALRSIRVGRDRRYAESAIREWLAVLARNAA